MTMMMMKLARHKILWSKYLLTYATQYIHKSRQRKLKPNQEWKRRRQKRTVWFIRVDLLDLLVWKKGFQVAFERVRCGGFHTEKQEDCSRWRGQRQKTAQELVVDSFCAWDWKQSAIKADPKHTRDLKKCFLIRRNRTKCANFRCNHLFQATYNTTENS